MCMVCWEDLGAPKTNSPAVRKAAVLINRLRMEFSEVGGDLHIVVDDWYIDDNHLDFRTNAIRENPHGLSEIGLELERPCVASL